MGAALWLGILLTIRGQTSWGLAIKLGIVVAILLTLMQLNSWPLERMSYDTNSAYGGFVFKQIAFAILFGVGSALLLSLVIPGAEPLYRASQPGRLRLSQLLTLRGMRSKEFFSSATVGLSFGTLLMLILIQHTQDHDDQAVQLKLDELIRATAGASNQMMRLEDASQQDLERIRRAFDQDVAG